MSDAWKSVKIREFQHVPVGTSVALLRVTGKPPRRYSPSDDRPVLLADDGEQVWRFAALPSPPDDRGIVRAAYSVKAELVAPDTVFSLELPGGGTLALPSPVPGASRPLPDRPAEEPAEPDETSDGPDDDRRGGLVSKLTELSARLAESEQARSELEAASASADTEAERQATAELRSLRDQVHALESRLALADERASESIDELAAARHRAEELEHIHDDLEKAIEEQREHIQRLEGDVAEAVQARDDLEQHAVGPLQAAREQAEQELAQARETIVTLTTEHAELETWRGELERRLTESIDELSAMRDAREQDGAELTSLRDSREQDQAELSRLGGELIEAEASVELLQSELASLNDRLAQASEAARAAEEARDAALAQVAETAAQEAAGLYSPTEREALAQQTEQLVTLLSATEQLTELARELSGARAQAESLHAAASAEPAASAEAVHDGPAEAVHEGPAEAVPEGPAEAVPEGHAEADESAHEAIEELRAQLAHARGGETDARIEAIAHAAESEARELAERELAAIVAVDQ
jgi:DNA repair exonuclease SbcCD ATPase subunit